MLGDIFFLSFYSCLYGWCAIYNGFMHKLETIASQNGFTIHDVPADGDCMFSAIVYQLNSIGIHVDSQTLRQNVAEYLQSTLEALRFIHATYRCLPPSYPSNAPRVCTSVLSSLLQEVTV